MSIINRPHGDPAQYDQDVIVQEFFRCADKSEGTEYGFLYWLANYCRIYNNDARGWVHFVPWASDRATKSGYDDQVTVAKKMLESNQLICLKARQIGQTTLVLAYFLWEALFHPTTVILLLSRGELEAKELLIRIKGMYKKLPNWMKLKEILASSKSEWRLSNGSMVLSLSSRRGDSYSATHVLIDEAALLHRANTSLGQVLLNLAPTIGQNGKIFIISKVDKARTISTFTSIYKAALEGQSDYAAAFVPYYVVPGRDEKWYQAQVEASEAMDGTLDYVYESFPETPEQALAPKSSDKRLALAWLDRCYEKNPIIELNGHGPDVPGLVIYKEPDEHSRYILTADPSEGLETSDPSAITVMDVETKEEVAVFAKPAEPAILGGYINKIGEYYNHASVLFELNQHGRALHLWLKENCDLRLLKGWAKKESVRKIGWDQNALTKALMYDITAQKLMDGECIINNPITYTELSSIDSMKLKAPKGQHDDRATTFALALAGIELCLDYKFKVEFLRIA
jgi:hypothetical protein